jgi:hypothetical protein
VTKIVISVKWNTEIPRKKDKLLQLEYKYMKDKFNLNLLGIDPEIVKILEKSYEFNLSRFEHSFTTIEEVEHFIYN